MKDFIKEKDCKFYINENARKTVCVYYNDFPTLPFDLDLIVPETVIKMPQKFVGIATCSSEDTWNEETGKRLAFLKMRKKFYTSYFKAVNRAIKYWDIKIDNVINKFNAFGEKIEKSIIEEESKIL